MSNPLANNPLQTRADLQQAMLDLFTPLKPYFSPGKARVKLGLTGSYSSARSGELEGFARPLWGLVPLARGDGKFTDWDFYLAGLDHGSDPQHPEYWGDLGDYDQSLVEMAAIGFGLALIPDKIWQPLPPQTRQNLTRWLNQVNQFKLHDVNWLFFRVMVNLGLKRVGAEYSETAMQAALRRLEEFYLGDGWYSDGPGRPRDYYIAFAMHFYGLVYATLAADTDPARAQRFKERAALFAQDFQYWFDEAGSGLPFGRSMTYRFAQGSFWSAMAFAGIEALPWGVMKGLTLRNLRWWSKQPIFDKAGLLTIGYTYPNLIVTESYISPASPYWATKIFQALAVPDTHPFWQAEEMPLPRLEPLHPIKQAGMIMCRDQQQKHVFALVSGQQAAWCTGGEAKYGKFAYSNLFGFSVPGCQPGLAQGAFDSTLALSEDGRYYRSRETCLEARLEGNILYSRWQPWPEVEVESWLAPVLPWHIRIHRLRTNRLIYSAEGGFALPSTENVKGQAEWEVQNEVGSSLLTNFHGLSGLCDLLGKRQGQAQVADPNTNLLYPRISIPTLTDSHQPGEHWMACAVLGLSQTSKPSAEWANVPDIKKEGNIFSIYYEDKEIARFDTTANLNLVEDITTI